MSEPVQVERRDLVTLLWSAVGYALGRKTFIASEVCALVRKHLNTLNVGEIVVMVKQIWEQERWGYGHDMDRTEWMSLLAVLERRRAELEKGP